MKLKRKEVLLTAVICLLILATTSCHYLSLERELSPKYKEFFTRVRYLITSQEFRTFLELPDEDKDLFIEEFWNRRDPDPQTEVNEFRMEYFDRMEAADDLFPSEGKPGWMTDRGRIFILYGAPLDRLTDPAGASAYSRCLETWYYGNFPVYFADNTCTGVYKLMTIDFTPIQSYHIMNLVGRNQTDAWTGETVFEKTKRLRFDWGVRDTRMNGERAEGEVYLRLPYSNLWFVERGGQLETELQIHLELLDSSGRLAWEHDQSETVRIKESELVEGKVSFYEVVIPFQISDKAARLGEGKNRLTVSVLNLTGEDALKKSLEFRF
ncbi:MAG: GWxTD domain-containing protein [Candidatus Aminicenantes bacterium]|nr:GWxTD domain-containing protein [Candidatus Aminicenantes bacterium]